MKGLNLQNYKSKFLREGDDDFQSWHVTISGGLTGVYDT